MPFLSKKKEKEKGKDTILSSLSIKFSLFLNLFDYYCFRCYFHKKLYFKKSLGFLYILFCQIMMIFYFFLSHQAISLKSIQDFIDASTMNRITLWKTQGYHFRLLLRVCLWNTSYVKTSSSWRQYKLLEKNYWISASADI